MDKEDVDTTPLSDTLQSIGLSESDSSREKVWFLKKPMDLCVCESEEHEHGVGAGAAVTLVVFVYY